MKKKLNVFEINTSGAVAWLIPVVAISFWSIMIYNLSGEFSSLLFLLPFLVTPYFTFIEISQTGIRQENKFLPFLNKSIEFHKINFYSISEKKLKIGFRDSFGKITTFMYLSKHWPYELGTFLNTQGVDKLNWDLLFQRKIRTKNQEGSREKDVQLPLILRHPEGVKSEYLAVVFMVIAPCLALLLFNIIDKQPLYQNLMVALTLVIAFGFHFYLWSIIIHVTADEYAQYGRFFGSKRKIVFKFSDVESFEKVDLRRAAEILSVRLNNGERVTVYYDSRALDLLFENLYSKKRSS